MKHLSLAYKKTLLEFSTALYCIFLVNLTRVYTAQFFGREGKGITNKETTKYTALELVNSDTQSGHKGQLGVSYW